MKVSSADVEKAMATNRLPPPAQPMRWDSLRFNGSGNQMLVQTDAGAAIVLDGYEGTVQRIFQPTNGQGTSSCFTPDDQSVLLGTTGGSIEVFNVQAGTKVKSLEGHLGPVGALACNPKYAQIASGCTNTCLWIW